MQIPFSVQDHMHEGTSDATCYVQAVFICCKGELSASIKLQDCYNCTYENGGLDTESGRPEADVRATEGAAVQGDWISQVQPFIQQRIERYAASEIRFNLLALTRDRRDVYQEQLAGLRDQKTAEAGDTTHIDLRINECEVLAFLQANLRETITFPCVLIPGIRCLSHVSSCH